MLKDEGKLFLIEQLATNFMKGFVPARRQSSHGTPHGTALWSDSPGECAIEVHSESASEESGETSASIEYSMMQPDELSRPVRMALWLINFYRMAISPMLPPSCRFEPTCSQYTYQAIARFGLRRGGWLGLKRLARCRPFGPCGYDPVPERNDGEDEEKKAL